MLIGEIIISADIPQPGRAVKTLGENQMFILGEHSTGNRSFMSYLRP